MIRISLGVLPKSVCERSSSSPVASSAPTARSMPMKNLIEERSVFWRSFSREVSWLSEKPVVQCLKYSIRSHMIPRPKRSPRYGGKCTTFMIIGRMKLPKATVIIIFSCQDSVTVSTFSPPHDFFESLCAIMRVEVIPIAREGRNHSVIICIALNLPASQSMIVVTSPIGLHAPPAFATMTIPTTTAKSLSDEKNRRAICIIMMVTVRLSRRAEKKKVSVDMRRNCPLSASPMAAILERTMSKNRKWISVSTMVMAASRNTMSPNISPPVWWSFSMINSCGNPENEAIIHRTDAMKRAMADLCVLSLCSRVMQK